MKINPEELNSEFWRTKAQRLLNEKISAQPNTNKAKNVIFFLGDGMSLATVAATRIMIGGEEHELFFEKFPHFGLSKVCRNFSVEFHLIFSLTRAHIFYRLIASIDKCLTQPVQQQHT